jgi:hypothetical protein
MAKDVRQFLEQLEPNPADFIEGRFVRELEESVGGRRAP